MQEKVQKIIEKFRPYIQMHGGDVELLDIENEIAKIKISGACVGCRLADQTYKIMLGSMIKEEVPEVKDIEIINLLTRQN